MISGLAFVQIGDPLLLSYTTESHGWRAKNFLGDMLHTCSTSRYHNYTFRLKLRDLFTPLTSGFSKIARDVGHAFDFQNGHRQRLIRHLQAKSCNFDKLQQFCKDEIRKKNQYKQDLLRIKAEYKKKCEEAMELKAKIANISNRTTSIGDTSNNPFRTPTCGAKVPHRSFITSTPYSHSINSGILGQTSVIQLRSLSTEQILAPHLQQPGSPYYLWTLVERVLQLNYDKFCFHVSKLVHMTSTMFADTSVKNTQKSVRSGKDCIQQDKLATSNAHFMGKIPASKKTKLDLISKTQPLPLKSI
ncbi:hypothetical protein DICVIV_00113 [Dictyocaulus viviparus]|uniref:Uncharacterized protein n=1 Tax=Dictyocaulus viviparus TaxID=29172 RepID=A0A0D8YCC0_DICVI|nr:hypothetical protein DICVIV_00113 [Dictyocaulus viviparus]